MRLSAKRGLSTRIVAVAVIVVVAVAALGVYLYLSQSSLAQKATLMLDFSPNSYHAPYYYGLQHNIYNDDGVHLSILPGTSSSATIAAVSTGEVDFGLADAAGLVYARENANISNVVMVAMIFQKNFYAVLYNKQNISTIQDLAGKTGGASNPSTSTQTKLFYLMAKEDGLNLTGTNIQYAGSSIYAAELADGKLQWILDPVHNLPVLQADAKPLGIQLGAFPFAENGLDTYGEALVTTTAMVQQHPSLVQAMVRATLQSVVDAVQDPSAAITSLVSYQPQLNASLSLQGYELDISCCLQQPVQGASALAYGWMDPTTMQSTVSLVAQGLGVTAPLNASSFYTDQFTVQP